MRIKKLIGPLVNLTIFAVAGIALYELGNRGAWTTGGTPPQAETVQTEVPVGVGTVVRATLHQSLTAYGHVEAAPASANEPAGEARVGVPSASLVSEVDCIEGQRVEKGQILFKLDSRAADAAVQRALQFVGVSQAQCDALSSSSRPKDTPAWVSELAEWQLNLAKSGLQQAEVNQSLLSMIAPISGTVATLNIRQGEIADPATPAVELVDMDRLVVALDVPGFYVSKIKIGQSVLIETPAGPISAGVSFVDPTVDVATGMASVDAAVPRDSGLKPGEFVRGQIVFEQASDCLAVPAEAIVTDSLGRAQIAVVSDDQRQASMQFVETGIREADLVEVRAEGLQAGESIVTTGAYGLASRTGIRVVGQ